LKKKLIYVEMVKGITIFIDGNTKIIRIRIKTSVGFIKIENDNQNVRWECVEGKYQWKKPTFPSQPNMIWIFSYVLCFASVYVYT